MWGKSPPRPFGAPLQRRGITLPLSLPEAGKPGGRGGFAPHPGVAYPRHSVVVNEWKQTRCYKNKIPLVTIDKLLSCNGLRNTVENNGLLLHIETGP